jgi:hypothetical protein
MKKTEVKRECWRYINKEKYMFKDMKSNKLTEKVNEVYEHMTEEIQSSKNELLLIADRINHGDGVKFFVIITKDGSKNSYKSFKDAENKAGVYFIYETESKKIVYVGESSNWCLKKRMSQHCLYHDKTGNIIKNMIDLEYFRNEKMAIAYLRENCSIYYFITGEAKSGSATEIKTKTLETFAILTLKPEYNIEFNRF